MDDPVSIEELQTLKEGVGKPSDQGDTETLEVVLLNQLIQVHTVCVGVHESECVCVGGTSCVNGVEL